MRILNPVRILSETARVEKYNGLFFYKHTLRLWWTLCKIWRWLWMDSKRWSFVCYISFKTSSLDEITYSFLKERICKKMAIFLCTKSLKLNYIPLVVEPKRQSYILDDEDVFVYLTSVDKEERRSILHVEVIEEMEIVPITEQQSKLRKKAHMVGTMVSLRVDYQKLKVIRVHSLCLLPLKKHNDI